MSAAPLLPFPERVRDLDPFEALEQRSRRLASVVHAISRRRDVRRTRAKILLILLSTCCPPNGRPRKAYYVRGAVARMGPDGLARAWRGYWGEEPPSTRTLRTHLGQLELHLAIVRSPGDWLPMLADPEHPERRPRFPDTIHVLESDQAAAWWAGEGRERLEANPRARYSPHEWGRLFSRWRAEARTAQMHLPLEAGAPAGTAPPAAAPPSADGSTPSGRLRPLGGRGPDCTATEGATALADCLTAAGWGISTVSRSGLPTPRDDRSGPAPEQASRLVAQAVATHVSAFELLDVLRSAGAWVRGRNGSTFLGKPHRARASAAMLAVALARGDRIYSRAAWVWRAWRFALPDELAGAIAWCERRHPTPSDQE